MCVGLDPEIEKIPKNKSIFKFNKDIIEKTADLVACYKPNIAFYESFGIEGLRQLKKTLDHIKKYYPNVPIILDAKRADIPNTAKHYAKSLFDYWGADAATVYPNLGYDSVEPFLNYKNKLTILIIKTSNKDSKKTQDINIKGEPYYLKIAKEIKRWNKKNVGLFVGATYPKDMKNVRKIFPNNFFLSAGIGSQGANIKEIVMTGKGIGFPNISFNASRSIIFASNPRDEASKLKNLINSFL